MTRAFVLGNGVSRRPIELLQLKQLGSVYGCNALYREIAPDCLVATDRPIAQCIQESGYALQHRFYTRRPIAEMGALPIPKKYIGNSSGPIACAIAALDGHRQIYLLGYDMGPDQGEKFNNMYAGTEFYKSKDALPTYTGNWVKQLCQISRDFPRVKFIRVCGPTTADIIDLRNLSNFQHLSMDNFLQRVSNNIDL